MSLNKFVRRAQRITRVDNGINGDAQRIEQITWLLFLKTYDIREEYWEFHNPDFKSIIPENLRWRNWALDKKDGNAKTGTELLDFVNNELFPALKELDINEYTPIKQRIVKAVFEDVNQYMKDGIQLRKLVNLIEEIDLEDNRERHAFGEIYETILRDLQSAGNAGEFYTPRAITDFMVEVIKPQLGEKIADFACGTGGFLTSSLNYLNKQIKGVDDKLLYDNSVYGIEKKPLPYLLAITNMLIHDIDSPQIIHGNSLEKDVREYRSDEQFDIILMNPPYGGTENEIVKSNFPKALQSSETADLFMILLKYRLKNNGRAAVVLPDGFLSGDTGIKVEIKKLLLKNLKLDTIVRLPVGVFSPYAENVKTNILFFKSGITENVWFYEHQLPRNYLRYTKTRPIEFHEFERELEWWNNKKENRFAWEVKLEDIIKNNYNLDISNPNSKEKIIEPSSDVYNRIKDDMNKVNKLIDSIGENNE